jgi:hypothetical protein
MRRSQTSAQAVRIIKPRQITAGGEKTEVRIAQLEIISDNFHLMRPEYPIGPFPLFINNFCIRLLLPAPGESRLGKLLGIGPRRHLLRLKPRMNNSYLPSVRRFSDYLFHEAGVAVGEPGKRG